MNPLASITAFFGAYGVAIVVVLGLLVLTIYFFSYLHRFFQYLKARKFTFPNEKVLDYTELAVEYTIGVFVFLGIIYALSVVSTAAKTYLWNIVTPLLLPFFLIFLLILIGEMVTTSFARLFRYLRGELTIKPRRTLAPKIAYLAEMVTTYSVYLLILFLSIMILLNALNLIGNISAHISKFFSENVGGLLAIIFVIVVGYIIYKFLVELVKALKLRSVREKQKLEQHLNTVIKFSTITVVILLIFTIFLIMLGVSNVNYIILIIVIFLIALSVIVLLATPLKNWISGIIILYSEPFLERDKIEIKGVGKGTVLEIGALFTKIANDESMIMYVPNATLLSNIVIINAPSSSNFPITIRFAVDFKVPHEKVEELAINAAMEVDGITDPKPHIIAKKYENHNIIYELVAYAEDFEQRDEIRSKLLYTLQDKFLNASIMLNA